MVLYGIEIKRIDDSFVQGHVCDCLYKTEEGAKAAIKILEEQDKGAPSGSKYYYLVKQFIL